MFDEGEVVTEHGHTLSWLAAHTKIAASAPPAMTFFSLTRQEIHVDR